MHRRFEGAQTAELRCPGGTVGAVVAKGFRLRLLGLMRLAPDEMEPLLFERCRSIHTHGMKTALDLVWLESDGEGARVLEVVEELQPGRHARAPRGASRRCAALELAPGRAEALGLAKGAGLEMRMASDYR